VNEKINVDSNNKTLIQVENPSLSFIEVSKLFRPLKNWTSQIHPSAIIDESAKVGENVFIGAHVVIESNAQIGDNSYIGHNSIIGENSIIGDNSTVRGNVSIYHDVNIGNNVHIDSGTVIGADGFGLVSENGNHHRVPHTGNVIIENDVAIGANCCVDRGSIESTIVGEFSKLDNFIQVAHNVIIGKGCVIAGQVGLAGSCELGDFVTIGGQSGIIGHIKIEDKCIVATNTLVTKSLKAGSFVSGIPARDHMKRRKQEAVINQLPQLQKRVRVLEKIIENKD
jgi:UDP-3-O-[3-hydroxymyristoyl] glucosamine N-acyltransferase